MFISNTKTKSWLGIKLKGKDTKTNFISCGWNICKEISRKLSDSGYFAQCCILLLNSTLNMWKYTQTHIYTTYNTSNECHPEPEKNQWKFVLTIKFKNDPYCLWTNYIFRNRVQPYFFLPFRRSPLTRTASWPSRRGPLPCRLPWPPSSPCPRPRLLHLPLLV